MTPICRIIYTKGKIPKIEVLGRNLICALSSSPGLLRRSFYRIGFQFHFVHIHFLQRFFCEINCFIEQDLLAPANSNGHHLSACNFLLGQQAEVMGVARGVLPHPALEDALHNGKKDLIPPLSIRHRLGANIPHIPEKFGNLSLQVLGEPAEFNFAVVLTSRVRFIHIPVEHESILDLFLVELADLQRVSDTHEHAFSESGVALSLTTLPHVASSRLSVSFSTFSTRSQEISTTSYRLCLSVT